MSYKRNLILILLTNIALVADWATVGGDSSTSWGSASGSSSNTTWTSVGDQGPDLNIKWTPYAQLSAEQKTSVQNYLNQAGNVDNLDQIVSQVQSAKDAYCNLAQNSNVSSQQELDCSPKGWFKHIQQNIFKPPFLTLFPGMFYFMCSAMEDDQPGSCLVIKRPDLDNQTFFDFITNVILNGLAQKEFLSSNTLTTGEVFIKESMLITESENAFYYNDFPIKYPEAFFDVVILPLIQIAQKGSEAILDASNISGGKQYLATLTNNISTTSQSVFWNKLNPKVQDALNNLSTSSDVNSQITQGKILSNPFKDGIKFQYASNLAWRVKDSSGNILIPNNDDSAAGKSMNAAWESIVAPLFANYGINKMEMDQGTYNNINYVKTDIYEALIDGLISDSNKIGSWCQTNYGLYCKLLNCCGCVQANSTNANCSSQIQNSNISQSSAKFMCDLYTQQYNMLNDLYNNTLLSFQDSPEMQAAKQKAASSCSSQEQASLKACKLKAFLGGSAVKACTAQCSSNPLAPNCIHCIANQINQMCGGQIKQDIDSCIVKASEEGALKSIYENLAKSATNLSQARYNFATFIQSQDIGESLKNLTDSSNTNQLKLETGCYAFCNDPKNAIYYKKLVGWDKNKDAINKVAALVSKINSGIYMISGHSACPSAITPLQIFMDVFGI